jgi:CHAT domain-containing protein
MTRMAGKFDLKSLYRCVLAIILAASWLTVMAQKPSGDRDTKLKQADKVAAEGIRLGEIESFEENTKAIPKLQAAEKIFIELGENERLLKVQAVLGEIYLRRQQYDAALVPLTSALAIARELNKPEIQIRVLTKLGESYFRDGKATTDNRERAREFLNEAAAVIEKTDLKPEPVSYEAYEFLGKIAMSLYDPVNAQNAFLKAVRLKLNEPGEESVGAIVIYAKHMIDLGAPKLAVGPLMDAGRRARTAKLPKLEALVAWCIGDLMAGKFRDLPTAKKYLDLTESLLAANPDEPLRAMVNLSWGKYYFATFDLIKSAEYFAKAYPSDARSRPSHIKGEVLLYRGILNYTIGSYEVAVKFLEDAVLENSSPSEKLMQMESLRYLARSLNALGRVAEAQKKMAEAMAARGDSGQGWRSSESVAVLIDNSDFFIESFQKDPGKDPTKDVRVSRAKNYLELGHATTVREKMAEYQAISAQRLAVVYSLLGDKAKAVSLLNESLLTARSAGLPVQEAAAMSGLMDLSLALGNSGAGTFYGKSAVNVYQQLRKRIAEVPPEVRAGYIATIEGTYRKLAALLIDQGRIAEAEQVLTMLKEEELIEYVRRDDAVAKNLLETLALTPDERIAMTRYDAVANQITALGKEFELLEKERLTYPANQFPKQQHYDDVSKELGYAKATFEKFLEELKLKFGENDKRVAQTDSILKKTLARIPEAKKTVSVTTIVGKDRLNIIVTTSQTQRAHVVQVTAGEINDAVAKLRQALMSPQYDPRPMAQQFYNWIVKPIEVDLAGVQADTIVWSFDGSLRYLPPSVFWDKEKGYLAERFANVMVGLANLTSLEHVPIKGDQLSVLGVGVSKPTDGFSALTAVPDELDCIVSDKFAGTLSAKPQCQAGVMNGRKLLDDNFTLANFEGELGRYPIVHIASHFKLIPGDDKNSFLLLGGGTERKFSVEKLRAKSLGDLELMVLSACNTATPAGAKANGTEVESFGTLAQEEARAVIATLWAVADSSTKDVMVNFYQNYGKGGLTKAEALRRAQLQLMYGKQAVANAQKVRADEFVTVTDKTLLPYKPDPNAPFAHPFYWSPFILSGNWR